VEAALAAGTVKVKGFDLSGDHLTVKRSLRHGFAGSTVDQVGIYLNTELVPALVSEGLAREVLRRVQTMRKEMGLAYDDRIVVRVAGDPEVLSAVREHLRFVMKESLADALALAAGPEGASKEAFQEFGIDGRRVMIAVARSKARRG
jgi:isoleucyl-tRNA synthetase